MGKADRNRFRTYKYDPLNGEVNNEPSMTVPDDAMSLSEILERHSTGRIIPRQLQAVWEEEGKQVIDTSRMTKIEKAELGLKIRRDIAAYQAQIKVLNQTKDHDGTKVQETNQEATEANTGSGANAEGQPPQEGA